jgi:hypothetical protein
MNTDKKEQPENNRELTPDELIKKHIQDPDHVVTDEEIKNAKVGEAADNEQTIDKETKRREDEIEHESPEDDLPNPYNVLGS